jgi:hypothetical protein
MSASSSSQDTRRKPATRQDVRSATARVSTPRPPATATTLSVKGYHQPRTVLVEEADSPSLRVSRQLPRGNQNRTRGACEALGRPLTG